MNILLVIADQLAARSLPAYGNRVVKTPHLDRLAAEGVVFEHAYCSSPLCAPSRASFITGGLPSRIGVYDNGAELPASVPTVAHHLRAVGYWTGLAGKMHFIGPDQLHGFEERLTPDIYPAGMHWIPDWEAPVSEHKPWYHDMSSVFEAGVSEASLQLEYDEQVARTSIQTIHDRARGGDGRPFLLVASFSHPHDPWEIPAAYWNIYKDANIDGPSVPSIPDGALDPHSRRVREMCGGLGVDVPVEMVLRARRGHYAAISYVDHKVGLLMKALAETGLRDETVVIFAADHGEMLGERGLWYKMTFFEPSAAVPLIVSSPRTFRARRVSANVSLLDLAPTLLELASPHPASRREADLPTTWGSGFDGASLVPLLGGGDGTRRAAVVGEYLAEGAVAPVVMIRRESLKFIASPGDPDQLFDVDADPDELNNLASTSAYMRDAAAFKEEVAARWDLDALREKVVASQRRRQVIAGALSVGVAPDWDYRTADDSGEHYVRGADFWAPFKAARLREQASSD
ncbi:MAG TPA: choline-sulfatase [Candidatus Dormibacteraeota bacterium]|nr:choline-sulfatase [Candidatus Dormibacteraeota bacterium]